MQSLDSVNVISQARIFLRRKVAGLFDKYTRINDWSKRIEQENHCVLWSLSCKNTLLVN